MKRFTCLTSLLIVCCSLCIAQDTTCGIVWYPPIQLSAGVGGLPKVAVSGPDTVHAIWEGSYSLRLPYSRSTNGGASFETVRELLLDSATYWRQPSDARILTSGHDVLVFFIGASSPVGFSKVYLTRSTDRGTTWQPPLSVSSDSGTFMTSEAVWRDTIALMRNHKPSDRTGILRTPDGASWSTVYNDHFESYTRIALSPFPSLPFTLLHLANVILVGGLPAIQYKRSIDLGSNWFDSTIVSSANGNASIEPDIAAGVDDSGGVRVFMAWRDNKYGCGGLVGCSIIGRQSLDAGSAFLPETLLTEAPTGYGAKMAIDGDNIAVAWDEEVGVYAHANVRISRNGGLAWCPVVDVTPTVFSSSSTRVAISRLGVHLVWMQSDSASSQFYVWYRRGMFLTTKVEQNEGLVPSIVRLYQNYPNPFNPSTRLEFELQRATPVLLKVFDMLGREVAILVNEKREAGLHSVEWHAREQSSGVYYYRLYAGQRMESGKALLIK